MLSEASRKLNPNFSIRKEGGRYVLSGVDVMTYEIRDATYSDAPDRFHRVFEFPEGHLTPIPYRNPDGTTNKVVAVMCTTLPDGTVIEENHIVDCSRAVSEDAPTGRREAGAL